MRPTATVEATGPPLARRVGRFAWERALDHSQLPPRTRLVAFALGTFADADGTNVRPGIAAVARRAGLPESTTRAHLKTLRTAGWADRVKLGSRGGTSTDADQYHLTVPAAAVDDRPAPAPAKDRSPAAAARCSPTPPLTRRPDPAPTTAHQPAQAPAATAHQRAQAAPDHRSPAAEPLLTSQRTTAHQPAPTNQDHFLTKARGASYASGPPPRCPQCSHQAPGSWGPPCGDCAALSRAHRARHTDLARGEARARRACRQCNEFGLRVGPDGQLPDQRLDQRCSHPGVPDWIWTGAEPPAPPPAGRQRRPDRPPAHSGLPSGWRPSPRPRPRTPEGTLIDAAIAQHQLAQEMAAAAAATEAAL